MKNKFIVNELRFDMVNKNSYIIGGWFAENTIGENQLSVVLDEIKLKYEMEVSDYIGESIINPKGVDITKSYRFHVEMPDDWKNSKKLRICISDQNGIVMSMSKRTTDIVKETEELTACVDDFSVDINGFKISGWYITDGEVRIEVRNQNGDILDTIIKKGTRPDVKKFYPECDASRITGYSLEYCGRVDSKITLHIIDRNCDRIEIFHTRKSFLQLLTCKTISVWKKTVGYVKCFGFVNTIKKICSKLTGHDRKIREKSYEQWLKLHRPSKKTLCEQSEYNFEYEPLISIVVPLYKTPKKFLLELVDSIEKQSYTKWELCLSDGSGEDSPLTELLHSLEKKNDRIKVVYNDIKLDISENTNRAIAISSGDLVAFSDHDDTLEPDALFECVKKLNENIDTDLIYTDEDKVDMRGKSYFMPHFKPDYNLDLLRSYNYFCHLCIIRKSLLEKIGYLNSDFNGAQDYDLVLRAAEHAKMISHVPKILYHWRSHPDSTAENPESKKYAFVAGRKAIQAHYDRIGYEAVCEDTIYNGLYRTRNKIKGEPLVSILIPNKDHTDDLDKCLSSIYNRLTYKNIECIVVENNSTEQSTFDYYKKIEKKFDNLKVIKWEEKGFNYAAINNYGARFVNGEYILLLNNDTEFISKDGIEELLGFCQREGVGGVGALLLYPDETVQHAGVVVGLGGIAGHAFLNSTKDDLGYFGRIKAQQDLSAVTAACLMVKKSVFEAVGGFDEGLAVAFNDVDLCLKIREQRQLIVYNPYVMLTHYESKSRGYEDTEEKMQRFAGEIKYFRSKWVDFLEKGDPYYNSNLSLMKEAYSIDWSK